MSFTLPWTVNKLVSTNINDADSITDASYGTSSLKVNGKTLLIGNTTIVGNTTVGNINATTYNQNGVNLNSIYQNRDYTLTTAAGSGVEWNQAGYIFTGQGETSLPNVNDAEAGIGKWFRFCFNQYAGVQAKIFTPNPGNQLIYYRGALLPEIILTKLGGDIIEFTCSSLTPSTTVPCWIVTQYGTLPNAIVTIDNGDYDPYYNKYLLNFKSSVLTQYALTGAGFNYPFELDFTAAPDLIGRKIQIYFITDDEETITIKTPDAYEIDGEIFQNTILYKGDIVTSLTMTNVDILEFTLIGIEQTGLTWVVTNENRDYLTDASFNQVISNYYTKTDARIFTNDVTMQDSLFTLTNNNLVSDSNGTFTPASIPVTIANWNFATPARATTNTYQIISAPYTAVTGWTLSNVVGIAYQVCIMRGFAQFINTFETLYPDYPAVTQAIGVSQSAGDTFRIAQNIPFTETGNYQLTFWIWGMYNTYRRTQTITASINGYSQIFIGVEQLWTKCMLRFNIATVGSYNLQFDFINTNLNSVLSMTSVKIEKQTGIIVSDGALVNNQMINKKGLFTTAIENRGPITNYGYLKNYGALGLFAPYSNGSVVIGTSSYGTVNSADGGAGCVFIGSSIAVASPNTAVIANYCIALGMGALEQLTAANRLHAIGFRCLRYNASLNDNIGYGYSCGENLGYNGSASNRNVCIGNYALNHPSATSDCVSIGHQNMTTANFTNGSSFCVSVGSTSMTNVCSNYNTQIGYGSVTSMVNPSSTYNTFVGAQVCNTQSGATNVMTNCTFLGATSNVSATGNYSNSTAVGYGALITGNNRIILGRSTETTFAMGGLNIPVSTILTLLGNISANSLTVTPVQLSYLSGITGGIMALSGNQTAAGVKTFSSPPVMSGASITTGTIPNSALVNGANYITTNLTQTISAVNSAGATVTITPAQFAFLNRVLISPSLNAGLIPQSAIANVSDFLKATVSATVSATWSFTSTLTISGTTTVSGTLSFTTNPTFNTDAIDSTWIDNTTTPRFIEIGSTITTPQDIDAVYTFNTNPVFNDDAIPAIKIDNTTTPRFMDLTSTQTCSGQKSYTGGLISNTLTTGSLILSNKSQLESVVVVASSGIGYNWAFGSPNTIVITGTVAQTVRFPNPTTEGLGTIINIVIQDTSVLTARCLVGSGFNVVDSENNQVLTITYPSIVRYVSFMCVSTGTGAWKYVGGQLPNAGIVPLNSGNNTFTGAINTFNGDVTLGSSSSNFINLIGNLYDIGTATEITPTEISCLAGCSSNIQASINTLNTKTTEITYNSGTTTTSFANNVNMSNINPSVSTDLNIGNSSQTTKIKGALTVQDGAQKVNGYSTLSGSPNVLTKPLSEYYTLSTSINGALELPVIDATMYGTQVTFTKISTAATWTINRGGTDTFRLYKSNSTATATSVLMEYNETVLRIVATQGGIWDVIQTDIFYNAASDWVVGTQYFPLLMSPTNITAATNWNTSLPSAFYGIHGFSITANSLLTLPVSTNINVPDGLRIKFRRVGGTLNVTLQCTASTGDQVMAQSSTGLSSAGTAVVLVNSNAFFGEIYLNKTTKVWYCM